MAITALAARLAGPASENLGLSLETKMRSGKMLFKVLVRSIAGRPGR